MPRVRGVGVTVNTIIIITDTRTAQFGTAEGAVTKVSGTAGCLVAILLGILGLCVAKDKSSQRTGYDNKTKQKIRYDTIRLSSDTCDTYSINEMREYKKWILQ